MTVQLQKANPEDLKLALDILREAKEWTERDGAEVMWTEQDVSEEIIGQLIEDGVFYFALVNGEPAGACTYQTRDPIYWPEIQDESTAFVHRLAVYRKFAGQGIGKAMIDLAKQRALEEGRKYLRLDCTAAREKLCHYYEKLGFSKKEVRYIEYDQAEAALFEMRLLT